MITKKGTDKLLKFHGLDPEKHSDSDVDDAIKNSVTSDDLDDLMNRARAADEAFADEAMKKYANRLGTDKDVLASWREDLISNRATTIKKLEAIPAPAQREVKQPLHNRATASVPKDGDEVKQRAEEQTRATAIRNRASQLVLESVRKGEKKMPFGQAWQLAENEIKTQEGNK